jgi:hypothetical protein
MSDTPIPNDRGAIAQWLDWLLGAHYIDKVRSVCAYLQGACNLVAGGTFLTLTQVNSLGVPWIAKHWLGIVGWAGLGKLLFGIADQIAKRTLANQNQA